MESYIYKEKWKGQPNISSLTTDKVIERDLLEITGVSMSVPKCY